MKQNEDGKTVQGTDVLFPQIGEIIGGSVREENYDKLMTRIEELNIPMKDMWWYLDTRKYGTCPHAGFGLGFERLLLFVTGMTNIRDSFPPYPQERRVLNIHLYIKEGGNIYDVAPLLLFMNTPF